MHTLNIYFSRNLEGSYIGWDILFSRVLFARIWPVFFMAPACGISLADVYAAQRGHEIIVFVSSCCFIN